MGGGRPLSHPPPLRTRVVMTAAKHTDRKEIGDVAMGLGADAGSAGIVRTKRVTFDQPGQEPVSYTHLTLPTNREV